LWKLEYDILMRIFKFLRVVPLDNQSSRRTVRSLGFVDLIYQSKFFYLLFFLLPIAHSFDFLLSFNKLNKILSQVRLFSLDEVVKRFNTEVGHRILTSADEVSIIPSQGPCLVLVNHPSGIIDPLIAAQALLSVRSDVRFLSNSAIKNCIPAVDEACIYLDILNKKKKSQALRQCLKWLRSDGCLVLFPGGEVANRAYAKDESWSQSVTFLLRKSKPNVLVMNIYVRNSRMFYLVSRMLTFFRFKYGRALFFVNELFNKKDVEIPVRLSSVFNYDQFHNMDENRTLEYLHSLHYPITSDND
jgi:hypothetical protein